VICDIARIDPDDVVETYPDVPILGFTNHSDTAGLRAAHTAGFDHVVAKSALEERARDPVEELNASGEEAAMTYVIAEPCIDIKDRSCVDVCPVDCIHESERMLVIDPEECIDCFAPDETFVTSWGLRTFAELENQWCRVLTDDGFRPALVKRFRR